MRRNLPLERKVLSSKLLDRLKIALNYQAITTADMNLAAQLWVDARRAGKPTADPKELDADVILAAQAIRVGAIVATENVGHLERFVVAKHWTEIV